MMSDQLQTGPWSDSCCEWYEAEIERLTAENEVLREDNLTLMATNAEQFKDSERLTAERDDWAAVSEMKDSQIAWLQARVETLESEARWRANGAFLDKPDPALAATEQENET